MAHGIMARLMVLKIDLNATMTAGRNTLKPRGLGNFYGLKRSTGAYLLKVIL